LNIILFTEREAASGRLFFYDERAKHLLKVLHKSEGCTFLAGVLGGSLGTGTITRVLENELEFTVSLDTPPPPRLPVRLGLGFARPIQLKRILREAANLGAAEINIFGTELGEKSYRETALFKDGEATSEAENAMREGLVQGRDTIFPVVKIFPSVEKWLDYLPSLGGPKLFFDLTPDAPSFFGENSLVPPSSGSLATLAVGSERGWSDNERRLARARGFIPCSLGGRALRTDAACLAALILAMEKMRFVVN
jgi:RsmE family RNA methyltransferase